MNNSLYIFSILLLFIGSCTIKPRPSEDDNSHLRNPIYPKSIDKFNFDAFEISQHALGSIHIGDNVLEVDTLLKKLSKIEVEAWDFGFDGGGVAYLYMLDKEAVLALIPAYETDSIIGIVALHNKLKTKDGLRTKITAGNLNSNYLNNLFYEDALTGSEYLYDSIKKWTFIFDTDSSNRIGFYPKIGFGSKVKNPRAEMDWILIL